MTSDGYSSGVSCSLGSLENPRKKHKCEQAHSSQPYVKPELKLRSRILAKILKHLNVKKEPQKHPQQTDFSIEDSRCILKNLAAELDRVVQLRDITMVTAVGKGEIEEEESCTLILEWADELRSLQPKSKSQPMKQIPEELLPEEQKARASEGSAISNRLKDAKRILSVWIREHKTLSQPNFRNEYEVVIKDLCKQWKKGQLNNILPVMDFTIKSLMLENKSEESILTLWFKTELKFKKPGNVYIPAPVWKCITKLSDKVTLDPNTANPTLKVSEDRRSVRTKFHEECDPYDVHHRKRHQYDGWPCVQATEGYHTGRHYWEVDVRGKCDWRVGAVKESAPRNGFINMNTTAGYWTLRLQLGSLMVLTNPVTKLSQPTPSKIGVYLDIEEGQLSFYDIEKRKHIYTFKTDFIKCGKVYPVFGTVETDRPLKIM